MSAVLHVAPALWSGAGAVITRLAVAQAAQGPVIVVTSGRSGAERDWPTYRRALAAAGVVHRRIDFLRRDSGRMPADVRRLAALVDQYRPSVIHAHAGVPSLAATLARSLCRERPRVIAQMYSWNPSRPEWMNVQDALGFGAADCVVCSAHAYRQRLLEYGVAARRLVYLPWGLPLEDLPWRGLHRPSSSPSGPRIGFVGRIEPRKGQHALVEVLRHVRRTHPDATLDLVGPTADASYAASIRRTVRRLGLTRAVALHGQVTSPAALMRTWDVFVSLSSDEGQGLAVLEAMATGVLVAAQPVAGISDFLVDGRTGISLTSRAPRAIAKRLTDAVGDPRSAAIIARARRMVERRYDWRGTVAAFARLYQAGV